MEIPSMENIPIVKIFFSNDSGVVFDGNETIIENLKNTGIPDPAQHNKVIFPSDGLVFLEALQFAFKTPYLSATAVIDVE